MNYSQTIMRAFRLVWQHKKIVWVVGLLGVLGAGVSQAIGRISLHYALTNEVVVDEQTINGYLIAITVLVCFVYLLSLPASGGLIFASKEMAENRPFTLGGVLRKGMEYAGHLIAIDTLVFLPMSGLLIALILVTFGLFVGLVLGLDRGIVDTETGLSLAGGGFLVCAVPLFCLIFPASLATFLVRTLAFRALILDDKGIRESIWVGWGLMRSRPVPILISAIIIWGIQRAIHTVVGTLISPLEFLSLAPFLAFATDGVATSNVYDIPIIILVTLIGTLVATLLYPYTITAWTLAYQQLNRLSNS